MACEIIERDGELVRIRIRGLMRLAELKSVQGLAKDMIEHGLKPRILVITDNFEGWEKADGWDDVGFLMEYGDDIVKIALVGDESWKEQTYLFTGKGLRATEIEFFPFAALSEAEQWVRA